MTFDEFAAARLLLSEERVGWQQRVAKEAEEAQVAGLRDALRRQR